MREIKFRAWDTVNKNMLLDEIEGIAFAKDGTPCNASVAGFGRPLMTIGDEPQLLLMQFTGLKDTNGKEIYEGDIVRLTADRRVRDGKIEVGTVVMDMTGVYLQNGKSQSYAILTSWVSADIIGNIYENPELLDNK